MRTFPAALALLPFSLAACQTGGSTASIGPDPQTAAQHLADDSGRALIFSDEFNTGTLDRDRWNVIGMDFWVNEEEQAYLDSPDTIRFADGIAGADGGVLVLRPVYRPGVDTNAQRNADFVSGRVNTRGNFDFTYGRAEARIRMPSARGVWPAFWLLGNGPWPATGEIDIMEYVGEPDWAATAIHGPGYSGANAFDDRYPFPAGTDAENWHVYAAEWEADEIRFYIDDQLTYRITKPMVEERGRWAFDNPKFVILNFAVGGVYPQGVNGIEEPYRGIPQETADRIRAGEIAMEVDWVRVYGAE